jgi:glycosyltransferase involved in cell wall biosynthesis
VGANTPVLTVITPVYNGEDFIRKTVNSVLEILINLKYEYIVINDGSTDNTKNILESFGSKIVLINKTNEGESAAVNSGLDLAKGTYTLIVNADDPLLTSKLFEDVFEMFESNKRLAAVYPDWQIIDPYGFIKKIVNVPDFSDEILIGECRTLPGPGTIFRTSLAKLIGGRDTQWKFVGDYDFWLRLSRVGEICHRPGVLAQWRQHPKSTSVALRGLEMAQERIAVMKYYIESNSIDEGLKRKALGASFYMAARLAFFSTEVPAKKYLLEAFKLRRGFIKGMKLSVIVYIILLPLSRLIINPKLRQMILKFF